MNKGFVPLEGDSVRVDGQPGTVSAVRENTVVVKTAGDRLDLSLDEVRQYLENGRMSVILKARNAVESQA